MTQDAMYNTTNMKNIIYIYIYVYMYVYIYIYRERERCFQRVGLSPCAFFQHSDSMSRATPGRRLKLPVLNELCQRHDVGADSRVRTKPSQRIKKTLHDVGADSRVTTTDSRVTTRPSQRIKKTLR